MSDREPPRNYLSAVLGCYCPRCRRGRLFPHPVSLRMGRNMQMEERCPICRQRTEIEVGFYYGTSYVSYVISLLLSACFFLAWWATIGFSFSDKRFLAWIILNSIGLLVLQSWLMRFSRALWLSGFVHYDPDWRQPPPDDSDRIVAGQMNNW